MSLMNAEKLRVIDQDGKVIYVTDLNESIAQTSSFSQMQHVDPAFKELDEKLHSYWVDLHNKLLALKK